MTVYPLVSFFWTNLLRLALCLAGVTTLLSSPSPLADGLPGPGFWPNLVGCSLLICTPFAPRLNPRSLSTSGWTAAAGLTLSCLLWMLLLPLAGWLPATTLAGWLACRVSGCSLRNSLLLPLILDAGIWLGLITALDAPLPNGVLGLFLENFFSVMEP